MKRVLIITYQFPPIGGSGVQRTIKFVKYLREFGWEPVIIAPKEIIRKKRAYDETLLKDIPEDVKTFRVYTFDFIVSIFLRISYFLGFRKLAGVIVETIFIPDHQILWFPALLLRIRGILKKEKIGVIYTTSPPRSLGLMGIILKKLLNVKWVADYRDPWTHNAFYNPKFGFVDKINRYMELKAHQLSDIVIANTPGNKRKIIDDFGVGQEKVVTITNGYDEDDFKGIDSSNFDFRNDKLNIVYTGTFYDGYAPDTFLLALRNLFLNSEIKKDEISIHIAGFLNIKDKDRIFSLIEDFGLREVIVYHGSLDHKDSVRLMLRADMLLLILWDGKGSDSWIPGKLYEYLRSGKPIFAVIPDTSDCAEIIRRTQTGYIVSPDVKDVEEALLRCYKMWKCGSFKTNPKREEIERYERRKLTQRLAEVFEGLVIS